MTETPLVRTITQVGIVVRDMDRALAAYTHKLGVGPWRVYTYAPPKLTGMRIRGVETPYSMKLALAWTGTMMWELIQPLDGPSIYQEFLRDHGEGIHHVMVDYGERSLEGVKAEFAARGWPVLMEGNYLGSQYAYFETEGSLTTTIEVRWSAPGWQRPEPDSWYPAPPAASSGRGGRTAGDAQALDAPQVGDAAGVSSRTGDGAARPC